MADFRIRVIVDPSRATRGIQQVNAGLRSAETNANRLRDSIRNAFAVAAIIAFVRQVAILSDTYTNLQNRLRVVTDTTTEFAAAQRDVFAIAQQTRAPIREIGNLYARAAASADELGATQADVERATRAAAQAIAIQGSTTAEARGSLLQFSQLLGGSVVQAQEFNSIIDGARPLLQAVAAGLVEAGGSVDRLRQLVRDGRVSSQAFFQALLVGSRQLEEQFARTTPTIGQSFVVLNNSLVEFVGQLDQATGASSSFSRSIINISQIIDSGIIQANLVATFELWRDTINDVTDSVTGLENEFRLLEEIVDGSTGLITESLQTLPTNIVAAVQVLTVETVSFFDRVLIRTRSLFDELARRRNEFRPGDQSIDLDEAAEQARSTSEAAIQASKNTADETIADILRTREERLTAFRERIEQLRRENALVREARTEARTIEEAEPVSLRDFPADRAAAQARSDAALQRRLDRTRADLERDQFQRRIILEENAAENRRRVVVEAFNRELITAQEQANLLVEIEDNKQRRIQEIQRASFTAQVSSATSIAESLASITRNLAGEQSGTYRALFAITKGFAIAEASINIANAISDVLATEATFPQKLAAAATIASQTSNIVSTISGVQFQPQGFQDGGFVSGPGGPRSDSINARLSNGEFVVNADATSRFRPMLEQINRGQGVSGNTIVISPTIQVTVQGGQGGGDDPQRFGEQIGGTITRVVNEQVRTVLRQESRPGGLLNQQRSF
ncbi:MAG: tape measure protein [Gammaproteobacteria bacterium]|nr:tape measure protein [Gammaproteobacteria bacterium]